MELHEIVVALAGIAAVLAGAFYEWRHSRHAAIEQLEKLHAMQRDIDSVINAMEALDGRASALEEHVSSLTQLRPIAVRAPRNRK